MKDSLKEKLLECWVENYSKIYKDIKVIKSKIENCVKEHNKEGIPSYIPVTSTSIRLQKTLYPFSDNKWSQIAYYTNGNPWNILKFLKERLCLFDGIDYVTGNVIIAVDCLEDGDPRVVRSPDDFPWVIELKKFVDEYTKLLNQFVKEIFELLKKFCKTSLNSESKLLDLIKYERVEEINL